MKDLMYQVEMMLQQEATTYKTVDYMDLSFQRSLVEAEEEQRNRRLPSLLDSLEDPSTVSSGATLGGITENWRERICEWCYQVVDHFDFSREVVCIAMHYLDRYLAVRMVNKRIFQLVAMAALSLAVKLFEPCKISMQSMIELSRGYFTIQQMEVMEMWLMKELKWNLHPPTAYGIGKYILYFLPVSPGSPDVRRDILELSRFLIELSIMDYFFVGYRPSYVAVAAIANAMKEISSVPQQMKRDFLDLLSSLEMDLADAEIVECRHRLQLLYSQGAYSAPFISQQNRLESTPSPNCVSLGTPAYQAPIVKKDQNFR